jgi:hypothetical protein
VDDHAHRGHKNYRRIVESSGHHHRAMSLSKRAQERRKCRYADTDRIELAGMRQEPEGDQSSRRRQAPNTTPLTPNARNGLPILINTSGHGLVSKAEKAAMLAY